MEPWPLITTTTGRSPLFALKRREFSFQALNEAIPENRRKRIEGNATGLYGDELPIQSFLVESLGSRGCDRGVELRELLHDDVLAIVQRNRITPFTILLQGAFAARHFPSELGQPLVQPPGGFATPLAASLDVLIDIGLREPVRDPRRKLGIRRPERHIDDTALAHLGLRGGDRE